MEGLSANDGAQTSVYAYRKRPLELKLLRAKSHGA
jgi:hypothetical protein